jgi:hypothetical protein
MGAGSKLAGLARHFAHFSGLQLLRMDHLPRILFYHHGAPFHLEEKLLVA